jgi:hypothetical protein
LWQYEAPFGWRWDDEEPEYYSWDELGECLSLNGFPWKRMGG